MILDSVTSHVHKMSWVEQGRYLHDRGWFATDGGWVSPHDSLLYSNVVDCVVEEMLREADGRPTPRSGRYLDSYRGECHK